MSDIDVHEEGFNPTRRGRTPTVSCEGLIKAALDRPGRWVSKTYTEQYARNVLRQIRRGWSDHVEVASLKDGDDSRVVYVRGYGDEKK